MKLHSKRTCIILDLAMLAVTASLMLCMFMRTPKRHLDVDRTVYPVKGIDLSAHNGAVDFRQVAADTVSFVMLKATEGTDFCDANFSANYAAAKAAGLLVGAYHFFRFNSPGSTQALHFLESVDGRPLDLPLAVDVEKWGNPATYDTDSVKSRLRDMLATLRSHGYRPMIYTNKHGYDTFIKDEFTDLPLWICSLSVAPTMARWHLWQHSHRGTVKGIPTKVDLNTFNGDLSHLMLFLSEERSTESPFTVHHDTIIRQISRL